VLFVCFGSGVAWLVLFAVVAWLLLFAVLSIERRVSRASHFCACGRLFAPVGAIFKGGKTEEIADS
jgi:predicted secreted protein